MLVLDFNRGGILMDALKKLQRTIDTIVMLCVTMLFISGVGIGIALTAALFIKG